MATENGPETGPDPGPRLGSKNDRFGPQIRSLLAPFSVPDRLRLTETLRRRRERSREFFDRAAAAWDEDRSESLGTTTESGRHRQTRGRYPGDTRLLE